MYGEKIDAAEYLRKFIDLEFGLPNPSKEKFIRDAIKRAGLNEKFEIRQDHEKNNIVRFLVSLSAIYGMSLRAIERCISRLKLVMTVTSEAYELQAVQVTLLIVLRSVDKVMFDKIVQGRINAEQAMEYLRSLPNAQGMLNDLDGIILETMLVAELGDDASIQSYRHSQRTILNRADTLDDQKDHVSRKLQILDSFTGNRFGRGRLKSIAATIDIAANLKD